MVFVIYSLYIWLREFTLVLIRKPEQQLFLTVVIKIFKFFVSCEEQPSKSSRRGPHCTDSALWYQCLYGDSFAIEIRSPLAQLTETQEGAS